MWIQIDKTLPWIELEETFSTKNEAVVATKQKLNAMKIKVIDLLASKPENEVCVPLIKIRAST